MTESSLKSSLLNQNNTNNVSFKNSAIQKDTNNVSLINNRNFTTNNSIVNNNNNSNNNSNSNGPMHHFRRHNIINHNQFIKKNVKDVSLLDSLKSNIINDSLIRTANYNPEKVYVRTNLCILTGDQQEIKKEKERRNKDVHECGFSSEFKEPYKPLGSPITDTKKLIIDSLQINPSCFQKPSYNTESKMCHLKNELYHVNRKIPTLELSGRKTGYGLLKSAINESNHRMHFVKYGVPYFETLNNKNCNKYDNPEKSNTNLNIIDYKHLIFDKDKQNYFAHITNTRKNEQYNDSILSSENKLKSINEKEKINKKQVNEEPSIKTLNLKKFEETFQFKHNLNHINLIEKFYETRDRYYDQRQRLNNILEEDLNRQDFYRDKIFKLKFNSFKISKNNAFIDDDIKRMRNIVGKELKTEREKIIKRHPWYNDMIKRLLYTTGSSNKISPAESVLLRQIRNIIEDGIPFTKLTYINILKVIPSSEFMSENIQRILRYIKQQEPIQEREYMEAIEATGHLMKMKNSSSNGDDNVNHDDINDNKNDNNDNDDDIDDDIDDSDNDDDDDIDDDDNDDDDDDDNDVKIDDDIDDDNNDDYTSRINK